MRISTESVLEAAGIRSWEDPVEVLRDGFPSFVARVRSLAYPGRQTVILKACPDASREPDVLLYLHRAGIPVPAVLDVRQGDAFRVVVLEDVGSDALYKHPDTGSYLSAVREIARIHRRFELSITGAGRSPTSDLVDLLPRYDSTAWTSVVSSGAAGTRMRLEVGTYQGSGRREVEELSEVLLALATQTLAILDRVEKTAGPFALARTLVHGDYHDGNVLIRPVQGQERGEPVIVDWDSARWDSGFFDLVSLCDVADRMGTCRLDTEEIVEAYLQERCAGGSRPSRQAVETEWHRCCILRAWDELRWFSETGEDFGDRAAREIGIIRSHLGWFRLGLGPRARGRSAPRTEHTEGCS